MSGYNKNKIYAFTDLDAWKEGHQLVLLVYSITKHSAGAGLYPGPHVTYNKTNGGLETFRTRLQTGSGNS